MSTILEFFSSLWDNIVVLITSSNPILDVIDILIVALIIYKAIQFLRETRAEQLLKGIAVFVIALAVAKLLNLKALVWLLDTVYVNAIIVLVVLFQPELRSILEYLGRGSLKRFGKLMSRTIPENDFDKSIDAVCAACQSMQNDKIGALIVIERETMLGEIASTGTIIEAEPSKELICNVFFPKSPLHDGAMIIRKNKIYAVGCILPLTRNNDIDSSLGTRHRAGIGVSEISDAIVVIVSEETGVISVVSSGKIKRNYNASSLKSVLKKRLGAEQPENEDSSQNPFSRMFSKRKEDGDK